MSAKRTYRLNADAIAAIRQLQKTILTQLPGESGFEDVLAFDPESDVPQPATEAKIREMMGDTADAMKLAPDLAYAIRKTGLVVTDKNKHLLDDDQVAAWCEALEEYVLLSKPPQ
jgi:hypothetical protein